MANNTNTTNRLPAMYSIDALITAGIDPKTGLPRKMADNEIGCVQKVDIKKQLRILDEQNAINRFKWKNLPKELNSKLMERILYYRGQGMFFKLGDKFYFLPYALAGTIDVYGRFTSTTPLPFNGKATPDGKEKPWITGLTRECLYEEPEEIVDEDMVCVLIKDYTEQISQTNISRQLLQDPILDIMADMPLFMRTALLNATGVQGLRVGEQSEYAQVEAASRAINRAALEGKKYIPVIGQLDFQELTSGSVGKAEEFLLAMQAMDNYRLSLYGLDNGGLFQKKAHKLESEQEMNAGTTGLVLNDSLECRKEACKIINSAFGLNIDCEISEELTKSEEEVNEDLRDEETMITEETKVEEGANDDDN